jgi:hypothetical protein
MLGSDLDTGWEWLGCDRHSPELMVLPEGPAAELEVER